MPVPCADPKDEEESEETCTWFLKALDVKFAEQEAVIRQLLENGPFRFTSEAYRASMMSMPAEALDAGGVRGSIMSMQSMGMRGSIAMRGSVVNDAAATMRGSHLDEQDGPFQVEVIEEEPEILHVFSQDDFTGVGSVCSDPPRPKSPRKSRMLGTQVLSERWEPDPPMKSFVKGPLDGYMGLVVIINLSFMIVMTQWMGSQANESLDLPSENLPFSEATFEIAEYIFFGFYLLDVLVRIYVLRREWVFDPRLGIMYLNLFDAFLVGLNVFELFLFPLFLVGTSQDQQSNSLRVVKLMRIVRTLRIVKTLTMFRQLRLLVGTCVASIGALFWSMVLLLVLKLGFALIICQALQGFIMDPAADRDARLEMNNLYGSFLKALYTMFEVTHSGSWPAVVRPVIEKVSPWYAAFFLTYLTLVVFAVIRVVTALFIKETLASAANDADMVMEDARRAAAETNLKLEELFLEADTDGDGNLTLEEFVATMSLPSVKRFLQSLDVSIRDVGPLFDILDDGDGAINATEFCDGLLRLKGQARAIDMVVLQHENAKLLKEVQDTRRGLKSLLRSWRKQKEQKSKGTGHQSDDQGETLQV